MGRSICWFTFGSQLWKVRCDRSSGAVYVPVHARVAYGDTRCSSSAASAVTGLKTEPGGYVACSARFSDGIVLLRGRLRGQPLAVQRLQRDAAGVDGRLVRRRRRHREDGAVVRVHRDDRAAARRPLAVRLREMDAVRERPLRRLLELQVERQPQRMARLRDGRLLQLAARPSERVDVHPRRAGDAAEIRVVGGLDAGLADHVAGLVALLRQRLQLLRGDLADVAEHLRRQRPVRVVADVRRRRLDAGELRRVLGEVVHHRVLRRLPQDDRRHRIALMHLDRGGDLVQRNVRHTRERAELVVAVDVVLRQVGRPELDGGGGGVRDEHVPVPVEDDAARSLDRDGAGS